MSDIPLRNKRNLRRVRETTDGYDEMYANTGSRLTGWAVMVICALVIVDVIVEFRTLTGLVVALAMGALGLGCYLAFVRPALLMGPRGMLIRNLVRDRYVPWHRVEGARIADALEVVVDGKPVRVTGVQLLIRDLRKESRRRQQVTESTATYTRAVLERVENNRERYRAEATGEVEDVWHWPLIATWCGLVTAAVLLGLLV